MQLLFPPLSQYRDDLALEAGGARLSWAELSRAVASEKRRLAIALGDRVAVVSSARVSTCVTMLAVIEAGGVLIPLNEKLGTREREHILSDAKPSQIIEQRELTFADEPARAQRQLTGKPALILYTSGTTGAPKGAVLTDRNIAANIDGLADAWNWTQDDVVSHALPLFHVHGLVLGWFGSLRVGGALRWHGRFDAARMATEVADGSTMLFGVPTMYSRLLAVAEGDEEVRATLASLRLLISGSAALPKSIIARLSAIGLTVRERYGLTETLINTAARADESPVAGAVGRAVDGTELRLVGDDGQGDVPAGEIGEVIVRGPSVFDGYLNRPDATAAVMMEGEWFRTGDMATKDEEGLVRIVGRKATDLIKTGGFKVGAGEIESCLLDHPAVDDVAVVGIADEDLGECIAAFVVLVGPAEKDLGKALADWVAERLAPHKRPRQVEFIADLPRNAMGKVQKKLLFKSQ